ncbi:MAG: AAA family ATPase [Candidatus Hodarchaeota archaeon]
MQGFTGSGKTSTLKRMVIEPEILGEGYIPVYLDAGHIKTENIGIFLLSIYKGIKESLSRYSIQIEEPNYSFNSSITFQEMEYFIEALADILTNKKSLVLVLDDFEKVLQKIDSLFVLDIFKFIKLFIFRNISIEQNGFKLILAGKRDLVESLKNAEMNDLLREFSKIELGISLEREKIEALITEPVKDFIKFHDNAIEEIVRITGRNLYCQQLLCFYIINYLNDKKKNVCLKADVNEAVKITINEKRDDFIHFWNNLNYESKLVYAALADEDFIQKIGRFFFLKEETLLNYIFDDDSLNSLLKKLHEEGHINQIDERRFEDYPYKIPLYGAWVKIKHTFKDTVIRNWNEISNRISLSGLEKLFDYIPTNLIPLEETTINNATKLSKIWNQIKSNLKKGYDIKNNIDDMIVLICQILGFEIEKRPIDDRKYYIINIKRLDIGELEDVLLFFPIKDKLTDIDIKYIQDEILHQDRPANQSFLICLERSEKIENLIQKRFLGLILLEEADLTKIVLSDHPVQIFKQNILIKRVKLSVVSPYKTEGPVRTTFYGRQEILGRILGIKTRNFAIIGARKIGKTSLLYKVIAELPQYNIPIYLDLETPKQQDYNTFIIDLQEKVNEKYGRIISFKKDLSNLGSGIRKLNQTGKKPIFFLDEVDILLKYDENIEFHLLSIFRSLANESACQVIISGYENLYLATKGIEWPLYNFCEIIRLDELEREAAINLITEPMEDLGIEYDNKNDRELILEFTSYHPNLLQFFCKSLIREVEVNESIRQKRIIIKKDIEKIYDSYDYEKYIINEFYLFFSENVSPIERLIVLLVIDNFFKKEIFTSTQIRNLIKENDIPIDTGSLYEFLVKLTLRYILKAETGGSFRFALPIFPDILRSRYDIKNLIKEAKEDAEKSL